MIENKKEKKKKKEEEELQLASYFNLIFAEISWFGI